MAQLKVQKTAKQRSSLRATSDEVHSHLIAVSRRIFPNVMTWLVSMICFYYLDLMLMFTAALIDCLRRGFCSLPVRQRLQMCRSLQLWYCLNSPPPLPVNSVRDKCEFAAVSCDSASTGETPCCASRRCAEHSNPKYVCNCWIALTKVKRKPGPPEARVKDVTPSRCGVPLRIPNPKCADCREGLIICAHRGECGKIAWTACPVCYRFQCEKCLDFICCGHLSPVQKFAGKKAASPVSRSIEIKRPIMISLPPDVKCNAPGVRRPQLDDPAVTPIAKRQMETKVSSTSPVESDFVMTMSAPSASGVINDRVNYIPRRNHVCMNVCDRYTSLADLSLVFGLARNASKQEKQAKKRMLATITNERSPTSRTSPPISSPASSARSSPASSSSSADARYKTKLLHGGCAQATDAYKITPGQPL